MHDVLRGAKAIAKTDCPDLSWECLSHQYHEKCSRQSRAVRARWTNWRGSVTEPTHHWPLSTLYMCPECEEVSQDANQCPACANPHVLTLSAVVNREKEETSESDAR